jgi:hypothetical protein
MGGTPEENDYSQLSLDGFSGQAKEEEVALPYGIVEEMPTFTKNGKGQEWRCIVRVPTDLWTEEEPVIEVRATVYANEARKKHLRPGDAISLIGVPSVQEIALTGGEVRRIHQFTVSQMEVVKRAKRTSITVYEQQKRKQGRGVRT